MHKLLIPLIIVAAAFVLPKYNSKPVANAELKRIRTDSVQTFPHQYASGCNWFHEEVESSRNPKDRTEYLKMVAANF